MHIHLEMSPDFCHRQDESAMRTVIFGAARQSEVIDSSYLLHRVDLLIVLCGRDMPFLFADLVLVQCGHIPLRLSLAGVVGIYVAVAIDRTILVVAAMSGETAKTAYGEAY